VRVLFSLRLLNLLLDYRSVQSSFYAECPCVAMGGKLQEDRSNVRHDSTVAPGVKVFPKIRTWRVTLDEERDEGRSMPLGGCSCPHLINSRLAL
jgi:hypothetical protein